MASAGQIQAEIRCDVQATPVPVDRRWLAFWCRFGWHRWSTWHVFREDGFMFDPPAAQRRRCTACGLYQQRRLE